MEIERVGIVGCGLMGSGIAELCARAGVDTLVREVDGARAAAAEGRVRAALDRAVARGRLEAAERDAAWGRLRFTTELDDCADRQLVIEAVAEDEALKRTVFAALDRIVAPEAILATNTSSIPVGRLAAVAQTPERVLGMHFFNPVGVLRLMELVRAVHTADAAAEAAARFATERLDRVVIHSGDRAGFIVNALLIPALLAAMRMLEAGFASAEDIDRGMVEGCNHPMGPLALADLIGLDVTHAIAESLHAEFREAQYAPPPILSRLVEAGRLGRKSGRGFYDYA